MSCKRYLVPLLVLLTLLASSARAEGPVTSLPEGRAASTGIDTGTVALAMAAGAGVGTLGALIVGDVLLTVGVGTVIAIYVGHLLLEALVVGGAIYIWPEREQAVESAPRPQLDSMRTTGAAELRLVTAY